VWLFKEGAVHGELFLQGSEPQQYSAIASHDARVLKLGRDVFHALYEHPEFAVAMVRDLAPRHHPHPRVWLISQRTVANSPRRSRRSTGRYQHLS